MKRYSLIAILFTTKRYNHTTLTKGSVGNDF